MVQPGMNPQMQMMQQPGMARMNAAGMSDPQLILNTLILYKGTKRNFRFELFLSTSF